jgi:site-specific DNA recombinase
MRIIGYCRVSTREQSENSHALEQQMERIRKAGATEILVDVESGTKDDRKAFNQLMQLASENLIQEVVITRLDRLTRSLITLRKTVDYLQQCKVHLRALDDAIDTSTAAGKFHLHMLGALAEMEVDRLRERIAHGMQHRRNRNAASPQPPFGFVTVSERYQLDHTPFLCLLENHQQMSKAEIARDIVVIFFDKRSLLRCVTRMNEKYGIQYAGIGTRASHSKFQFYPASLREWLHNPVLRGHTYYGVKNAPRRRDLWDIRHDTHPDDVIMTEQEYQAICDILSENRERRGFGKRGGKIHPLSGLVRCGACGSVCDCSNSDLNAHRRRKGEDLPPNVVYYYQCQQWKAKGCNQKKTVRESIVEALIIGALTNRAEELAAIAQLPATEQEPLALKELRSQLAQLQSIPNPNQVIIGAKDELQRQITNFQVNMGLESQAQSANRELLLAVFQDQAFWDTYLTPQQKRDIYRKLVNRAITRDGQVVEILLKV